MFQTILILILVGGASYGGYSVSEYRWEKRESTRLVSEAKARETQTKRDQEAVATHANAVHALNRTISDLKRKKDVTYQTKDVVHPFSISFVRDFNWMSVGQMSFKSPDTEGPSGTDDRTADVTRTTLLDTHAQQMILCRKWKSQLDGIIGWDRRTYED